MLILYSLSFGLRPSNVSHLKSKTETMEIESNRLILIEVSWDDLKDIHRLHSFPEVDEFNTLGIPKDIQETREVIRPMIEEQSKVFPKSYMWKIIIKDSKEDTSDQGRMEG